MKKHITSLAVTTAAVTTAIAVPAPSAQALSFRGGVSGVTVSQELSSLNLDLGALLAGYGESLTSPNNYGSFSIDDDPITFATDIDFVESEGIDLGQGDNFELSLDRQETEDRGPVSLQSDEQSSVNTFDLFDADTAAFAQTAVFSNDFTTQSRALDDSHTAIPTPALLPGFIGMGIAALRKRSQAASKEG
ncbi:MAG: PTPA-CTERM sorting domain-containing protein [Elainellaceae cyanobacterium]